MMRRSQKLVTVLIAVAVSVLSTAAAVQDSDGDGVADSHDYCPNTPTTLSPTDFYEAATGCAQSQLDVDLDGICNPSLPKLNGVVVPTTTCAGVDNCPYVYNPGQAWTTWSDKGDACNRGEEHCRPRACG